MKRMICLILSGILASAVAAQEAGQEHKPADERKNAATRPATHEQAVEFLKKVDAATKTVESVSYKGRYARMRDGQPIVVIEGTAYIAGALINNAFTIYRFDAAIHRENSEEVQKFTVGSNGEEYFLVDHQTKKVRVDIDPAVIGTDGRAAQAIGMIEFVHPTPFGDEIRAESCEMKETAVIGGEPCQAIHVVYAGGVRQQATWYFSKKDFLPRRVHRIIDQRERQISTRQTVSDLVVGPKIDMKELAPFVPEGFTKTDEFAPNRTPYW